MSDLKLETSGEHEGDLAVEMGDLVIVDGIEAIAQDIWICLRFFKGEWDLDQNIGMPYFQKILVKAPNMAVIRQIYQKAILSRPGVQSITELTLTLDSATRTLRIAFRAKTIAGPLTFDKEFIL
jgi:hypothetical protein